MGGFDCPKTKKANHMNPLPINILQTNNNCILYEVISGKPNREQPCTIEEDTRGRVFQSAVKGNACWYYTFNFLRQRIGKNPCVQLLESREIEKNCSSRNKKQIEHSKSLPSLAVKLHSDQEVKDTLKNFSKEKAFNLLDEKTKADFETPESLDGRPSLYPFILEFVCQNKHSNLYEFLLHYSYEKRNQINENFLKQFGLEPEKLYDSQIKATSEEHRNVSWTDCNIIHKAAFLNSFVRNASAFAYGLHKSPWSPHLGAENLIDELKKNGPLFVMGYFGKEYYKDKNDLFVMKQKYSGRDIYAWKPGAKRVESNYLGHAVLLVGAKKVDDKAFVFFIDSQDTSNPKDKSQQKIFLISFSNLTENINDLSSIRGAAKGDSPFGYAYHGNFNL